jgi:hypothetical protein
MDTVVVHPRVGADVLFRVVGAVKDVSFLIDVLPAYIFPKDERLIGECVVAGFSLGGHATWLTLRQGAYGTAQTQNASTLLHIPLPSTPSHTHTRTDIYI